ncbi:hypothetical protein CYMTET_46689 [Cymbomonas tetramitiformis]|uniref:Uncharacterized protein n=1 Tax=Cymbomonas tetramitiformis TaxID=36881 RepID=A0AAE0BVQ6_9CHLO|nr:hypothetical protein CYMTET_46689 [Cymbomonas tetramitiformis]
MDRISAVRELVQGNELPSVIKNRYKHSKKHWSSAATSEEALTALQLSLKSGSASYYSPYFELERELAVSRIEVFKARSCFKDHPELKRFVTKCEEDGFIGTHMNNFLQQYNDGKVSSDHALLGMIVGFSQHQTKVDNGVRNELGSRNTTGSYNFLLGLTRFGKKCVQYLSDALTGRTISSSWIRGKVAKEFNSTKFVEIIDPSVVDVQNTSRCCYECLNKLVDNTPPGVEFLGTAVFIFLFGEAVDACAAINLTDVERVGRLHATQVFLKIMELYLVRTTPTGSKYADLFVHTTTLTNFSRMCNGIKGIDMQWKALLPDAPRYPRADGSARVKHKFGCRRMQHNTFGVLDLEQYHKPDLIIASKIASGEIPTSQSQTLAGAPPPIVNMAPDPVDAEDAIDTNHMELEELDDSVSQAIQSSPETTLYEGVAHADVRNEVEQEVLDNIDMPISLQAPEDPAPIAPVATPNRTSVYLENLREAVLSRCLTSAKKSLEVGRALAFFVLRSSLSSLKAAVTRERVPGKLTSGLLSSVLDREVVRLEEEEFSEEGVNSTCSFLTVSYSSTKAAAATAPGSTERFFVKRGAGDAASLRVAMLQRWYEREVKFYQKLQPHISSVMETPRCRLATVDPTGAKFLLILEDVSASLPDSNAAQRSTKERAETVVHALATMQASMWESPSLKEFRAWLPVMPVHIEYKELVAKAYAASWETVRQSYTDYLPDGIFDIADALAADYPALLQASG